MTQEARSGRRNTARVRAARGINLASLFGLATQALAANQSALNEADRENQNHGSNMVQTFSMISQALASQPNASPSDQLSAASQYVTEHSNSGSAQVYAQGLAQAAQQYQGQSAVTPDNAMLLIQSLLGGGQAAPSQDGGDLLGTLLGGGQPAETQAGGDLLGSLVGSLLGGQTGETNQTAGGAAPGSLDLASLLSAGLGLMNSGPGSQTSLPGTLAALLSGGPLGQKPHRQQSGELIAQVMLQAISALAKGR